MFSKVNRVILWNHPDIGTRPIYPEDTEDIVEDKQERMFQTEHAATVVVSMITAPSLLITVPRGFIFDGASIPFKLGKGNMKLLIPALFHDYICSRKQIVRYDRWLANEIFYRLLLMCHVSKPHAVKICIATGLFQCFRNWSRK